MTTTIQVPDYLPEESRKQWVHNTAEWGEPVHKGQFWFWPKSAENFDNLVQCRPFRFGIGGEEILACAIWNDIETEDVWFDTSPIFLFDPVGPELGNKDPEKVYTMDEIRVIGDPESAQKRSAISKYNLMILGAAGAAAAYLGFKVFKAKKTR